DAVTDASLAHDQRRVAAEHHELLDCNRPRDDDVGPLGLEPSEAPPLPERQDLQSLAHGRDVRLMQSEPVARVLAPGHGEMEPCQGTRRPAEREQLVSAPRGRQGTEHLLSYVLPERADLSRTRRVPGEEPARHADRADGQARRAEDGSRTDL